MQSLHLWKKISEKKVVSLKRFLLLNDSRINITTGGTWHKVIFKQIEAGLNLEFSFFLTDYMTKAKEPRLLCYW